MSQTILVVDDNDQNRALLHDVLVMSQFNVLLAKNGKEAVRLALEHHPDLILMDIQMPVMNGLEAGKLLRSDPRTRDIGIFALSCSNVQDSEDDFFITGFDGYIIKPIDIRKLPKTIISYLSDGKHDETTDTLR
ncbi:MAG: response regulator [Desulfuromonadaceae bacterium]|nr:response regulator [Desulfuromonadaceae bacterium]MDD5105231.1 response regulator [Desulfuromonadaceae bacterium]